MPAQSNLSAPVVHWVTSTAFRNARGGLRVRALCGLSAKAITTIRAKATCQRCRAMGERAAEFAPKGTP